MTIRQLEIFIAIAEEQNVTRAAQKLHISQSAASMSLGDLEEELNGPLFDRIGRRLVLNDRGETLYPRAVEIIVRTGEIKDLLVTDQGSFSGQLKISASSTIGNYILPVILGKFLYNNPSVEIQLEVGNTDQVVRSVKTSGSDLGFVEGPCLDRDLSIFPWREDRLAVFSHPGHRLSKDKTVSPSALLREEWILREKGSGTREVFERMWNEKITDLKIKMELGNSEAIKQAVLSDLGISCLSLKVIEENLRNRTLTVLDTPELDLKRTLYIISHREKYWTPLLRAFGDHCGLKYSLGRDQGHAQHHG